MSEITYPATFVKGTQTRTVRNVREAVKARFDGFKTVTAVAQSDHPVRAEIQAAAKAEGIPANQKTDVLVEALVKTDTDTAEEGARPEAQVADEGDPQPVTPDTLDQEPAPAAPDTEGAKGSTEAPKPTAPGKSSTRTTR